MTDEPRTDPAQFAIETLQAIDRGGFLANIGAALARANEANRTHQQKASITVTLTIESVKELGETAITIAGRVSEKLPTRPPRPQFLYRTSAGGLSLRDERQPDMFGLTVVPGGETNEAPSAPQQAAGGES